MTITKWEETYKKGEKLWGRYADKELLSLISKLEKNSKILDVGCGDGRNLIPLCKRGFFVEGLEVSKEALSKCEKKLKKYKLTNFNLKKGSALELDYKNNSFDLVILSTVLRTFKDKEVPIVFREIYRVLKKKGTLFLKDSKYDIVNRKRIDYFTKEQIESNLKGFNIKISKITKTRHKGHKGAKIYSKDHTHYWIIIIAEKK